MATVKFFDERTDQSEVKARIVQKYFYAWAQVIMPTAERNGKRIAYIDLYAGPGRYKDGAASTPLLVLFKPKKWQCITHRLACLVLDCTIIDQSDRLEFSSARRRIEAIDEILNGSQDNVPLELIGEEALWLLSGGKDFVWDDVQDSGELKMVDGRSVTVRAFEYARSLEIAIYFGSKGSQNYRSVNLNVSAANHAIKRLMADERIQVYDHTSGPGQFVAHISC